ncbi:glycosyl transferase family group 2-domain-containing protein [Pterulicium gracile]|uniref:Glycosyl transferase family group 2-domain-containing protein n=1 Tax=Pterulicium gracile TaxID=1884261 RepID=A0A5C3Q6L8_9AGAR|nr:glycosyl transferase family group 2-domain-containing protein [Pterula gracilis]
MDDYDAYDAILHHLFKLTQGDAWFKPAQDAISGGVCLRVDRGIHFRVFPYENFALVPFEQAVRGLNPVVAIKLRSAAVHSALGSVADDATAIHIDGNTRIQILETMLALPMADKEQCAAFIRDERVMIIWSDDLDSIIPIFQDFEAKLIKLVYSSRASTLLATPAASASILAADDTASNVNLTTEKPEQAEVNKKAEQAMKERQEGRKKGGRSKFSRWFSWKLEEPSKEGEGGDPEKGEVKKQKRPIRLFAPIYGGMGAALSVFFIASGLNILLQEWRLDGDYTRFALLVSAPFLFCVSIFFSLQLITNITFVIGPVAQFHENSKYYSAIKPEANPDVDKKLPHITIQIPVYKESLEQTIMPSVFSIKKAMQTYALQGGTSAIMINDDGIQLISASEREDRLAFYANHNIGWIARPGHDGKEGGFKRAGRFKKASNMNYGLDACLRMEKCLRVLVEQEENGDGQLHEEASSASSVSQREVKSLEERALDMALEEMFEESGKKHKGWGGNARSLRIGEVILICDADTIVPEDCFRDAARELVECPEVAIIQHESDVMQVSFDFFENGIAHFTRRINRAISMACANGEVAPFVGHNAFLRWSAIQDAAFIDEADGKKKMWSESNVSEDFDMALRLQLQGYIIRWSSYSKGGFKEGVSLTVDDELNRWQKYSYGCNELLFNPLIHWWRKGPITKQLRIFIWSDAPVHYKISMMAYMFSYYGIAASAMLSLLNYLILGFELDIDGCYIHSFEIFLACTVVFPGAGNVAFTLLEYRLGQRGLMDAAIENLTWVPFFFFFFGGLSIHLSTALLAHLFSYNITWGATKKEVERSNFFIEVPKIWNRFWGVLCLCTAIAAGMVVLSIESIVGPGWVIPGYSWAVILPLAVVVGSHILFPILLNPWLMIFSY